MVKNKKDDAMEVEEITGEDESDDDDEEHDEDYEYYRRKRRQWIVLSVLIVVAILIIAFYYVVINPQGVMDIYPDDPIDNDDETGIKIQATIAMKGTSKAEGSGDLKIELNGKTTYSSKISVKNGIAYKNLKYSEFVEGNGDYEIYISFDGVKKKFDSPYSVNWVVEKLDVALDRMTFSESENITKSDDPFFHVNIKLQKKHGRQLTDFRPYDVDLELFYEDEQSSFETSTYKFEKKGVASILKSFEYDQAGNITAKVSINSEYVKSSSDYYSITYENTSLINSPPSASGILTNGNSQNEIFLPILANYAEAEFDASNSFDPDGEIVKYQWEFDDDESDDNLLVTTIPYASHRYTKLGTYNVILTVTDKYHRDMNDLYGFDTYIIEVKVVRI
jgi:hypothetical protein